MSIPCTGAREHDMELFFVGRRKPVSAGNNCRGFFHASGLCFVSKGTQMPSHGNF